MATKKTIKKPRDHGGKGGNGGVPLEPGGKGRPPAKQAPKKKSSKP